MVLVLAVRIAVRITVVDVVILDLVVKGGNLSRRRIHRGLSSRVLLHFHLEAKLVLVGHVLLKD